MKAALEGVCYQVRDVLEAMSLDCGIPLRKLLVDGGMTVNDHLMQMQADYTGIPVGELILFVLITWKVKCIFVSTSHNVRNDSIGGGYRRRQRQRCQSVAG